MLELLTIVVPLACLLAWGLATGRVQQLAVRARLSLPPYREAAGRVRAVADQTRRYAYEYVGDAGRMVEVRVDDDGRWSITRVDPRTGRPLKR